MKRFVTVTVEGRKYVVHCGKHETDSQICRRVAAQIEDEYKETTEPTIYKLEHDADEPVDILRL